jgi:hypothetical protein
MNKRRLSAAQRGRETMSTTTVDANVGVGTASVGGAGPLEQKYLEYPNYRAVAASGEKVTKTHWHIAIANGAGWGFDGMDGVIFGLIVPLVMKDFSVDIPTLRTGGQIALMFSIAGLYFWPWLSDRLGRRTLLAINILIFSLLMPVVALSRRAARSDLR